MGIVDGGPVDATLGERELDVMGLLWHDGPGTVAEVRERLTVPLAYNTVLTILRNLEAKGFVGHTAEGRLFRYHPAVSEQAIRGSALSRLVDKLFRGSALRVVAHMVEQETLSPNEMRKLHRLLDERLSAGTTEQPRSSRPRSAQAKSPRPRRPTRS
jgi:predicted transcriptional regulator